MDAVEGRGLAGGGEALVGNLGAALACRGRARRARGPVGAASSSGKSSPWSGLLPSAASCSRRAATACAPSSPKSCFARSAIGSRRTTPFLVSMTRPSHFGKLDAERLREAAHHVEDEREALGLAAGRALFVFVVVRRLLVLALVARGFRRLAVRALQRPQEERGEPRVLLDARRPAPLRALASAVPSTCASALRPTTSQTFSRYSASSTSRPSAVSTFA